MVWPQLDIPPGSALEADLMMLRLRIKQVVKWYFVLLFATVIWMMTTSNFAQYSFGEPACRRTFTFCFGEGGSVISDLTQYARAAALARRMNYKVLIDDSTWKYGQLSDYFIIPSPECEPLDHLNVTQKFKVGAEGWESKPHVFADNSVDLDKIVIKGMSLIEKGSKEDGLLIFDNHSSHPITSLQPAGSWWSDEAVFEEIRNFWKPNKRIREQILHMVWLMHSSISKRNGPSQRLWLAKYGHLEDFKKKRRVALLPYSQFTHDTIDQFENSLMKETAITPTQHLFPTPENLFKPESAVVVLFCDTRESERLEKQKKKFPQCTTSKVISTPAIIYKRRSKNLHITQVRQADIVIRDLIYANESSDQIVCHTADVQCRFLLLLSKYKL
ncbi:hypothetical protein CROQUDRAFT_686379 [Cronartium quercuum f. sp. fusiforme G11]|uniref:Uncharacterized protein n=1 Tax=Cronartium quercuum f. sp. fusiforme G11 TaxID=708437 RepID=A0A9P6NU85_9BASI|nr:hypothetical protein CROQUDRAFT_686379 [Cronartium quercuum f. sp. fusiforme G11]